MEYWVNLSWTNETPRYVHGKDSPLRGHSSLGLDYAAVRELMPTARPKDH